MYGTPSDTISTDYICILHKVTTAAYAAKKKQKKQRRIVDAASGNNIDKCWWCGS